MTHESSPEPQSTEVDRLAGEVAYAQKMRSEHEERLAELLGVLIEDIQKIDPREIHNISGQIVKWAMQASHYEHERRRQSGDPNWYLKK